MIKLVQSGDFTGLQKLFDDPKSAVLADVNHQDPTTGYSILHMAAASAHVDLVKWCLEHGVDVFLRDRKNKLAQDLTRNDKIRSAIKTAASAAAITTAPGQSPFMQGVLYKWTNFASGYKPRWFVLEDGILSYYRNREDATNACRGSLNVGIAKLWIDHGDKNRFDLVGKGSVRYHLKANHPMEAKRWIVALTQAKQFLEEKENGAPSYIQNTTKTTSSTDVRRASLLKVENEGLRGRRLSMSTQRSSGANTPVLLPGMRREASPASSITSNQNDKEPPFSEDIKINYNSARAQLFIQEQLLKSLMTEFAGARESNQTMNWDKLNELATSFNKSITGLRDVVDGNEAMSDKRERWWKRQVDDELERQRLWEDSLRKMAIEHQEMQEALAVTTKETEPKVDANLEIEEDDEEFFDAEEQDDFYDASLTSTLATVEEGAVIKAAVPLPPDTVFKPSYSGYPSPDQLRTFIPPIDIEKPSISIWGVLKNSIGKDLTKITLPVIFNEPTSMLQRFCEDIEYSELLDKAQRQRGSTERMLYVAAFAVSNYSSTDGRIAKPFNPLLGETFEYVRPEKGVRYFSEQVSHHPPVSACFCDSPNYNYFSEVNVKSKFWGKSYELLPEGVCHVELKIPKEHTANWNTAVKPYAITEPGLEGRVREHYSWNKVTTAVQNIIVGKLYIEHYGDMVIKNHRTGDECVLSFKQRGWGGKNAYVMEGYVKDPQGKLVWDLYGKWNERMIAVRSSGDATQNNANGLLDTDAHEDAHDASSLNDMRKALLLWKINKPTTTGPRAFNLPEFAATLNDLPTELKGWLPATDCRLRPDQRAMEQGEWDLASSEKVRLEEQQRSKRRAREARGEPGEWPARWFERRVEKDTGENYWIFDASYWKERETHSWTNVDTTLY
jgi:hypothetical protein